MSSLAKVFCSAQRWRCGEQCKDGPLTDRKHACTATPTPGPTGATFLFWIKVGAVAPLAQSGLWTGAGCNAPPQKTLSRFAATRVLLMESTRARQILWTRSGHQPISTTQQASHRKIRYSMDGVSGRHCQGQWRHRRGKRGLPHRICREDGALPRNDRRSQRFRILWYGGVLGAA